MSYAAYFLPHVYPSAHRASSSSASPPRTSIAKSSNMIQSAHPFQPGPANYIGNPSKSYTTSPASVPGVQRKAPFPLAARGPSSPPQKSWVYNPLGHSSPSSSYSTIKSSSPRTNITRTTPTQAAQAAGMHRKSRATCTLSLAHVSASAFRISSRTGSGVAVGSTTVLEREDETQKQCEQETGWGPKPVEDSTEDTQNQAQALKDFVGDAPVHMQVGLNGSEVRSVEVEVPVHDEDMVAEVDEHPKTAPQPIPSKLPIRTKKSRKSLQMHAQAQAELRKRQSEINIIPFPTSGSYVEYRESSSGPAWNRARSNSISSSYSSTSSRSSSHSSSSSSSSSSSNTSVSSSPPHFLLRNSPPSSASLFMPLGKRSRRGSGATLGAFQPAARRSDDDEAHPTKQSISINTSVAPISIISASRPSARSKEDVIVDDRDPPSPSSPTSASSPDTSSSSLSDNDSAASKPSIDALKSKLGLGLALETTPPPPYSALPPPYSLSPSLLSPAKADEINAKADEAELYHHRDRRPLPPPPTEPVAVPANPTVIHAPVPRAAFVRVEVEVVQEIQDAHVADKASSESPELAKLQAAVALPPIAHAQPISPPKPKPSRLPVPAAPAAAPRRPRVPTSELKVLVYLYRTVVCGLERRYRQEGERAPSPTMLGKQKEGPSRFPLVEEDDEDDAITRTPHPSPSTSPSGSPGYAAYSSSRYHPSACSCSSSCPSSPVQSAQEAKEKAKAKQASDSALDVQDALLAIRLRGFLRAQGVPEGDLDVRIYTHGDEDAHVGEEPRSSILVEDDGEEEEGPFGDFGELELDSDGDAEPPARSSALNRPLKASPPPPTKASSESVNDEEKPIVAPSTAYMIALLTMRYRYAAASRRKRVPSGTRRSGANSGGRKSKLGQAAWVAGDDGLVLEEEEADFDCYSVVDWYT